jgi:uroporphyrinogen-III synthase
MNYGLTKTERLTSQLVIDKLFAGGNASMAAFPLRIVYMQMEKEEQSGDAEHDEAVMYYTVANDFTPDEAFDYNMLVFFSPEGIHSLIKNFPHFEQGDIKVACLGTKTIKAAEEAGIHVDFQPTPELRSVPAIIEAYAKTLK